VFAVTPGLKIKIILTASARGYQERPVKHVSFINYDEQIRVCLVGLCRFSGVRGVPNMFSFWNVSFLN
jgi:hypothetical protein